MDTAICTVVLAFFVGLANTNAPVPLSEYVQVPGKFMAPIPRNSLTIIRDVSLQLCAAKCTLAFRMKTFPCYAFEYTTGSRMCVHTNMTTLVINGGYLGLQKNPAVNYYERSKASYSNLFQSREHAALKQQNTYFAIKLNQTLEECAYECMRSTAQTCMSFSHSPSSGACGLSNVFYGDGHAEITLVQSHIYNHYQYYTSWPCNVTLPENYGPRALASLRFPYQSIRHVQCHMRIEAPVGKQVQILFPTVFFGQDVCNSQTGAGLSVHDGNSGSGPLLGRYCRSTTDRSHPPLLTSASGSMYVTYTADDVPVAFESIYQFVTVDLCVNNKCTNGATCLKTNTSYVCECISGFTGQFCDVNVDDCFSSPCLFQGQCIDEVNGYRCNCTHEFTGKRCEKFIGACRDSPCEHGACVITSRYNYTCTCETGYVGRHCHTIFTPCMSSPCQHGTCGTTAGGYVCKCSPGFTGRNCDRLAVDLCTFTPCKHGRCSSTSNLDVLCTCDRGYSGKYCDIIVDYCAAARCQNGSCVSHDNGYTCQCHSGFKGQHCETALTLCEIHAGDCHPGICYPFANLPEGYVCRCPDNTYHRHCNVTSDPCSTSPCHHGACHKVINGYNCTCTTGYKGDHCDVTTCWVADCGLGLCEDTPTGYSCICPIGYGGKNCQVRLTTPTIPVNQSGTDNCLSSPCQHHAICLNQNHGYTCVCQPNWTGSECGERADVCHGNPCVSGVCVVMGTAHRCDVASNVSSPHGVHDTTVTPEGTTDAGPTTRADIICEDNRISIHVPADLLPTGREVTWNDPSCVVTNNGTHLVGTIGLDSCGTVVHFNDTHVVFENDLVSESTNGTNAIDFGLNSVIPVQCVYPRRQEVSTSFLPVAGHARFYEKGMGHLQVQMRHARDVTFDETYDVGPVAHQVTLNKPVYLKLTLGVVNQTISDISINVDRCFATPSSSLLDSELQELTDNGCPASPSVMVYPSPGSEVHFSFRAFRFTGHPNNPVYVHCQVFVCSTSNSDCIPGCNNNGRKRRAAVGGPNTHLVSSGPYRLSSDQAAGSSSALVAVTGLCVFLAVAATVFGVLAWRGRKRLAVHYKEFT